MLLANIYKYKATGIFQIFRFSPFFLQKKKMA